MSEVTAKDEVDISEAIKPLLDVSEGHKSAGTGEIDSNAVEAEIMGQLMYVNMTASVWRRKNVGQETIDQFYGRAAEALNGRYPQGIIGNIFGKMADKDQDNLGKYKGLFNVKEPSE